MHSRLSMSESRVKVYIIEGCDDEKFLHSNLLRVNYTQPVSGANVEPLTLEQ